MRSQTAPPADAAAPVDLALIREYGRRLQGGSLDFVRFYCRTAADDLAGLQSAFQGGRPELASFAHRIKGAAQLIGAREVEMAGREIEQAVRRGDRDRLPSLIMKLRAALARIELFLVSLEAAADAAPPH